MTKKDLKPTLNTIPSTDSSNNTISKLITSYSTTTSTIIKLIDSYLLFVLLTGIFQFIYVILASTFPFNAFLSGFTACVGTFVFSGNFFVRC